MAHAIALSHVDPVRKAQRIAAIRATMARPEYSAKLSQRNRIMMAEQMPLRRANRLALKESRPERDCGRMLRAVFGDDQVVHHPASVNGFRTDFYVAPVDCYVQFDGVYYHGLDRPYAELAPEIRRKYDRDRLADKRFPELGLRLVRITDKQWLAMRGDDEKAEFVSRVLREPVQ